MGYLACQPPTQSASPCILPKNLDLKRHCEAPWTDADGHTRDLTPSNAVQLESNTK